MTKPLSLKWRLILPMSLALATVAAIVVALAYDTFSELVVEQTDRSLLATGRAIQSVMENPALSADRQSNVRLIIAADATLARIWPSAKVDGIIQIGSPGMSRALDETVRNIERPSEGSRVYFEMSISDERFRGVWISATFPEGAGNVVVARSTTELYEELHELLWSIAVTAISVLIAMVVVSSMVIVVSLRPIGHTAHKLAGITAGNLGMVDWSTEAVPAELEPFVQSVEQMLDRLNAGIQQQKTFVADAAHELRTPLAVAKSTLQVALTADRSRDEYRQALQEATDDLRRMEHIVNELLTLARIEESGGRERFQELDLFELVQEVTFSFDNRVSSAGGSLTCEGIPARICGDASQLERLFSNLVNNAFRHGPAGGAIQIRVQKRDSLVEVLVQDAGGNIPPEHLPNLFDRFYRVDSSRTTSTGGVGLGLAIAKAIVVRHGGDIRIESDPAAGTQVRVCIPLAK